MASEGGEETKGFRVVDRRRFTMEGEERSGPNIREERPTPPEPQAAAPRRGPEPARPPPSAQPEGPGQAPGRAGEEEVPFSHFVQSLAQQAMLQLGLIPWPHTGQRELHLEQARDTIDVLAMLKRKTQGNLTADEARLLENVLYELRMAYVEVNQQLASRARGGAGPGP